MRERRMVGAALIACAAAAAAGPGGAGAMSAVVETGAPSPTAWSPGPDVRPRSIARVAAAAAANAVAAGIALRHVGVPYVWGGASPAGFDCSGLPAYAYAQVGVNVPHYTVAIWEAFPKVPADRLQVGDLVFFHDLGHVGIYIGGGSFVHAPHTGDVVKVSDLATYPGYAGAVRPG